MSKRGQIFETFSQVFQTIGMATLLAHWDPQVYPHPSSYGKLRSTFIQLKCINKRHNRFSEKIINEILKNGPIFATYVNTYGPMAMLLRSAQKENTKKGNTR